jgi:hypothetical protein
LKSYELEDVCHHYLVGRLDAESTKEVIDIPGTLSDLPDQTAHERLFCISVTALGLLECIP